MFVGRGAGDERFTVTLVVTATNSAGASPCGPERPNV
jgi:hypothetical protein